MKRNILAGLIIGLLLLGCQSATSPGDSANNTATPDTEAKTPTAPPTDFAKLANRIVNESAGVKEGDIVLINGTVRDMELQENIVTEVQKVGGHALLSVQTDRMGRNSFTEVPEKYDSKEPKLGMELARIADVTINIGSSESEAPLAGIDPARLAASGKAGAAAGAEFRKNKVRGVFINNNLYPTVWRAKRFDMPLDEFGKQFWDSVNTDYTDLQATGEKAKAALNGKVVEITHPNGTNLKMGIEGRPAYISDGVISDADVEAGNLNVYLPAGEAAVTPVANSGDGKFVVDKTLFQGKEVTNLTLNFEGGKMTSMTGEGPGFEGLKASYDAGEEGKELLGFVDLGINSVYKIPAGNKLGNWISAGVVTVGTGNNTWANGSNNTSGGIQGHLTGATVKIDGKIIVENGVLKL